MQSQYQFILFQRNMGKETISLTKNSQFYFSKAFLKNNDITSSKNRYVTLFYDPEAVSIAIRFLTKKRKYFFKVSYTHNGGAMFSCRNFLKVNEIDSSKYSGRYPVKIYPIPGEGEAFVIDLKARAET